MRVYLDVQCTGEFTIYRALEIRSAKLIYKRYVTTRIQELNPLADHISKCPNRLHHLTHMHQQLTLLLYVHLICFLPRTLILFILVRAR